MDNTDLDHIEELAQEALATGWERRLPQNCLDVIREVRYWRRLAAKRLSVTTYCPGCDYEVEVDALDAYRFSEKHKHHCQCGAILQIRLSSRTPVT